MGKILVGLFTALCVMFSSPAIADEEESPFFAEGQVWYYAGGESPLLAKQMYLEHKLPWENFSVWGALYHDKEFKSGYVGIARKFGDLQIGLGVGPARYDDRTHTTTTGWLFYLNEERRIEALGVFERYRHDADPWFYKGYVQKALGDGYLIGVYGEKDVGIGPKVGMVIGNVKVWAFTPVINRQDGGTKFVIGVAISTE